MEEKNDINDLLLKETSEESNTKRYILAGSAFLVLFFGVVGAMKLLNSDGTETKEKNITGQAKPAPAPQMANIPLDAGNQTIETPMDKAMENAKNSTTTHTPTPPPTTLAKEAMQPVVITPVAPTPHTTSTPSQQPKIVEKQAPSLENNKPVTSEHTKALPKAEVKHETPKAPIKPKVIETPKSTHTPPKPETLKNKEKNTTVVKKGEVAKKDEIKPAEPKAEVKKEETKKQPTSGEVYIQIGSYSKEPPASFYSLVKANGYNYKVSEHNSSKKVLVGPFKSKDEAAAEIGKIRANINSGAFIAR